jgi:hypothetical protein
MTRITATLHRSQMYATIRTAAGPHPVRHPSVSIMFRFFACTWHSDHKAKKGDISRGHKIPAPNEHGYLLTCIRFGQLTNHTVSGEGGRPKPALGESWKSVPSVRILLAREDESDFCSATVTKQTLGVSSAFTNWIGGPSLFLFVSFLSLQI